MVFWVLLVLGACGVVAGEWLIGRLDRPAAVPVRVKRPGVFPGSHEFPGSHKTR
jgi:hypothetical protein